MTTNPHDPSSRHLCSPSPLRRSPCDTESRWGTAEAVYHFEYLGPEVAEARGRRVGVFREGRRGESILKKTQQHCIIRDVFIHKLYIVIVGLQVLFSQSSTVFGVMRRGINFWCLSTLAPFGDCGSSKVQGLKEG